MFEPSPTPFTQRRRQEQDWSAFGGGKRRDNQQLPPVSATKSVTPVDFQRNSLAAYVQLAAPPVASGPKWEQSAIRQKPKPAAVLPKIAGGAPDAQSEELFPTLGGSTKKMEKSSSGVSLAERMKQRLQEEEEERKRQEERAAAEAREREEEERRNRMLGVIRGSILAGSSRRFDRIACDVDYVEDAEPTSDYEPCDNDEGDDLEYDAYGRPL